MKQLQRIVTLALALSLIGVPAVTMAQTSPSSPAPSGTTDKAHPADKAMDKPSTPSASPSTAAPADSSMKTPLSAADCQNNGFQKFGLKTEAECTAKLKK
jgi:hypothetical protein